MCVFIFICLSSPFEAIKIHRSTILGRCDELDLYSSLELYKSKVKKSHYLYKKIRQKQNWRKLEFLRKTNFFTITILILL